MLRFALREELSVPPSKPLHNQNVAALADKRKPDLVPRTHVSERYNIVKRCKPGSNLEASKKVARPINPHATC
jgi:hypothetical protein